MECSRRERPTVEYTNVHETVVVLCLCHLLYRCVIRRTFSPGSNHPKTKRESARASESERASERHREREASLLQELQPLVSCDKVLAQYNTAPHSTAQHHTAQHSTAQHVRSVANSSFPTMELNCFRSSIERCSAACMSLWFRSASSCASLKDRLCRLASARASASSCCTCCRAVACSRSISTACSSSILDCAN